ncbi:hypothetical protein CRD60_01160 [Bifidobacterium aemilianum]|uniref:Polymerase n=1 Tax=Bifidobacterium aemilianum TaxID=2493120 RepID=A0A366K9X4_9BIFI|nr:hypothetical protein [Bifidobacterium aemilianum]RBP98504.1 hypothetical protein CRD60_01160 [Bifidobacterium aemilianum]
MTMSRNGIDPGPVPPPPTGKRLQTQASRQPAHAARRGIGRIHRPSLTNSCYYLALAYYTAATLLSYSFFISRPIIHLLCGDSKRVLILCIVLIIINECLNEPKYSFLGTLVFLPLMLTCSLVTINTGNPMTLAILFFVYGGRRLNLTRVLEVAIAVSLLTAAVIVLSSQAGMITDYIQVTDERRRHFLGFLYALHGPQVIFNCMLSYIVAKQEKIRPLPLLSLVLLSLGGYLLTNSRSLTFMSLLAAVMAGLYTLFYRRIRQSSVQYWIHLIPAILTFPILAVLSFYIPLQYTAGNGMMAQLNRALGYRLSLAKDALQSHDLHLFGDHISWSGGGITPKGQANNIADYNYVDSSYIKGALDYGIIFMGLALAIWTLLMIRSVRRRQYIVIPIFLILALHATADDLFLRLCFNSLWLCAIWLVQDLERWSGTEWVEHRLQHIRRKLGFMPSHASRRSL